MLIGASSCQQLPQKSQKLDERDSALSVREKELSFIEEDYQRLLKMQDSLLASKSTPTDSIANRTTSWTDSLVGVWDSRLVCTSTTCKGYVIGDRRNEQWHFVSDSTGFYLHVEGKADGLKIYHASYSTTSRELVLTEQHPQASEAQTTLIFNNLETKSIRGQQHLTGADDCKTVFSIQLIPRANKI